MGQDVSCSILCNVSEKLEPHYCAKTSLYLRHVVHIFACSFVVYQDALSQAYGCMPLLTNLIYSSFYFWNLTNTVSSVNLIYFETKSNILTLHYCILLKQVVYAISVPFAHTHAPKRDTVTTRSSVLFPDSTRTAFAFTASSGLRFLIHV